MGNADPTGGHVPQHCPGTCSKQGCSQPCGELKGHQPPHKCLAH